MDQSIFINLTPEQEALFYKYREKWFALKYAIRSNDSNEIEESIHLAYSVLDKQAPKVILCESPYQAIQELSQWKTQSIVPLMALIGRLRSQLPRARRSEEKKRKVVHPEGSLSAQLRFALIRELGDSMGSASSTTSLLGYTSWFDFCISALSYPHDLDTWKALKSIVKGCGFIFPFEAVCLVVDRPTSFSLDELERFHTEAKPAVTYADGFNLYFYHGVGLPAEYGQLPTQEWKAQWLFQESDHQVRRALLHGIGYEKIAEDLQVIEIDSFKEYSLLKVENDSNYAIPLPILLVKWVNVDTGKIQLKEVPLYVETAWEGILAGGTYWFVETENDSPTIDPDFYK